MNFTLLPLPHDDIRFCLTPIRSDREVIGSDWGWWNVADKVRRRYERGYEGHKESGDDE